MIWVTLKTKLDNANEDKDSVGYLTQLLNLRYIPFLILNMLELLRKIICVYTKHQLLKNGVNKILN